MLYAFTLGVVRFRRPDDVTGELPTLTFIARALILTDVRRSRNAPQLRGAYSAPADSVFKSSCCHWTTL